jgi:hypothetical protein
MAGLDAIGGLAVDEHSSGAESRENAWAAIADCDKQNGRVATAVAATVEVDGGENADEEVEGVAGGGERRIDGWGE